MSGIVLDSSALLAFIYAEPGSGVVAEYMNNDAVVSAVNWSEVLQKLAFKGGSPEPLAAWVLALGPQIASFDVAGANAAAAVYAHTKRFGLSFGDRACLTLAQLLGVPVLTADKAWAGIPGIGINIMQIR